jgi:PTH1 family peptidyl-tRNA hydrolase
MSETWLIVGLGNPGEKYQMTRHNIGFMSIDLLAKQNEVKLKEKNDFKAKIGNTKIAEKSVILAKPLTFMNDSGYSISKISEYYEIPIERVLVIYDDVTLDFGKLRLRGKGSAGGHNGIKSIIESFENNNQFPRLKVGIGKNPDNWELIDYVLGNFTQEEQEKLPKITEAVSQSISIILSTTLELAMNEINNVKVE